MGLFIAGAVTAAAAPTLAVLLTGQVLLGTGAAALLVGALVLAREAPPHPAGRGGLDPWGQLTAVLALGALTFAVIQSGSAGWRATSAWAPLAVALTAAAAFVAIEDRGPRPMLIGGILGVAVLGAMAQPLTLAGVRVAILVATGALTASSLLGLLVPGVAVAADEMTVIEVVAAAEG